ncbi:hypothetical protein RB597_000045 [Gaeumannomyces tritici]
MSDPNYLPLFYVPASVLLATGTVVTVIRFRGARLSARGWGWDDTTAAFAMVVIAAYYAMLVVLYVRGRGTRLTVEDPLVDIPLEVASGIIWIWGLNLTRISIALMLLPLRNQWHWWRWTLWSVVAVNVAWLPAATAIQMVVCRPISALWQPTPDAVCLTADQLLAYARAFHCCNLLSNLILSLLPLTFIHAIYRPRPEKLAIACLMMAGIGATAVEVLFLAWFLDAGIHGDIPANLCNVLVDLFISLQLLIGFVATSLPKAKAPIFWLLRRLRMLPAAGDHDAAGASPDSLPRRLPHGRLFGFRQDMPERRRHEDGAGGANVEAAAAVAAPPPWKSSQTETVRSNGSDNFELGKVSTPTTAPL